MDVARKAGGNSHGGERFAWVAPDSLAGVASLSRPHGFAARQR